MALIQCPTTVFSDNPPPNALCTTFTCFSKLPPELRLKIWSIASLLPRNLGLWAIDTGGTIPTPDYPFSSKFSTFKYWSNCPTPAVLQICKESRIEGLKWYNRSFCVSLYNDDFTFETQPKIYANHASDRWCLQDGLVMERDRFQVWDDLAFNLDILEERGPKSLAINIEPFFEDPDFEVSDVLSKRTQCLEEIIIYRYRGSLKDAVDYDFERIEFLPSTLAGQQKPYLVQTRDDIIRFFDTTPLKGKLNVVMACIKIHDVLYGYDWDQEVYFPDEDSMWATIPATAPALNAAQVSIHNDPDVLLLSTTNRCSPPHGALQSDPIIINGD